MGMTKEERLQWLQLIEEQIYVSSLESTFADDMKSVAIHSIIDEEIERIENKNNQESMLDKIRAEIENHCGLMKENHCRYCSYCNSVMGVREIIEIIDKYKAESEGKE